MRGASLPAHRATFKPSRCPSEVNGTWWLLTILLRPPAHGPDTESYRGCENRFPRSNCKEHSAGCATTGQAHLTSEPPAS